MKGRGHEADPGSVHGDIRLSWSFIPLSMTPGGGTFLEGSFNYVFITLSLRLSPPEETHLLLIHLPSLCIGSPSYNIIPAIYTCVSPLITHHSSIHRSRPGSGFWLCLCVQALSSRLPAPPPLLSPPSCTGGLPLLFLLCPPDLQEVPGPWSWTLLHEQRAEEEEHPELMVVPPQEDMWSALTGETDWLVQPRWQVHMTEQEYDDCNLNIIQRSSVVLMTISATRLFNTWIINYIHTFYLKCLEEIY